MQKENDNRIIYTKLTVLHVLSIGIICNSRRAIVLGKIISVVIAIQNQNH